MLGIVLAEDTQIKCNFPLCAVSFQSFVVRVYDLIHKCNQQNCCWHCHFCKTTDTLKLTFNTCLFCCNFTFVKVDFSNLTCDMWHML